jgi:long-chain acyl-CoA synthetase
MNDEQRRHLIRHGMAPAVTAAAAPDRPAVIAASGTRTFAELNGHANQLVRALRRRGLRAGDGVALLAANRPEFAEVTAAVFRGGFVLTPINWHLNGEEAGYILGDCEAKAFIADARFADTAASAAGAAAAGARTALLSIGGPIDGFEAYDDCLAAEDPSDIEDPALGRTMLYTSGTTGRPKGVYRPPFSEPREVALGSAVGYDGEAHVHLCTGPLYHAAPLLVSLLIPHTFGVPVVLMDGWEPEEMLRLIQHHRVTHSHVVPTMFHRLRSLPDEVKAAYDVSSLVYIVHGAAPCPVEVKKAMIEWWGPILNEYYAATEGGGTSIGSEEWLTRPGTVGRPGAGQGIRICDDNGDDVAPGTVGTVYMKAPETARFEYFKDPAKTSKAYNGDWFTLGDMGYLDADGYLFLTDRSANLIISGGVNIYPAEVDAVLLEHGAVADVATIGVPNDEWGEEVKAVVKVRDGVEPSPALAAELIDFCRGRLARFKCPRTVDFVDELPRHDTGKIYKRLLRDQYRAQAAAPTQAAATTT